MSSHADHARNGNQPFQPIPVPHVRLGWDLAHRYRRPLRAALLGIITGRADVRGLGTSHRVFSDEILAKYRLAEMQKPQTNSMIYRTLGSSLSVASHHIHMTVSLSFAIRPAGVLLSPSFRISRQTSLSFPMAVNDRLPGRPLSRHRQADRVARTADSDAASLGQLKKSSHLTAVFLALRHRAADGIYTAIPHPQLVIANGLAERVASANRGQGLSQPPTVLTPMSGAQPLAAISTIQPTLWQAITAGAQGHVLSPVAPDLSPPRPLRPRFQAPATPRQRFAHHALPRAESRQAEQPQPVIGWQPSNAYHPRIAPQKPLAPIASRRATTPSVRAWSTPHLAATIRDKTDPIRVTRVTEDVHRFSVIRREDPLEPPRLAYPLVQPPVPQAAQVVTTVREQEVVKVVRNEIQSYMASGSPLKQFSRSDYANIADHVYSSLTRRLIVEKERLGLR